MRYRLFYSTVGMILGLGAPVGWLICRAVGLNQSWWINWVWKEIYLNGIIYGYLTISTLLAFILFGYFLGHRMDHQKEESDMVKDQVESLNRLATTDGLTNLVNARHLHNQLAIEMEVAERYNFPLTCLLIDIDFFKRINDKFGHPCGDIVLATLGKILKTNVRRIDIPGRLGGEEFLILLPHTPLETAGQVAERIRNSVENFTFDSQKKRIHITISIGVVSYPDKKIHSKNHLLKCIDEALYRAKQSGRNKIEVWGNRN